MVINQETTDPSDEDVVHNTELDSDEYDLVFN